jgi:signal transduction histidine kinase
MEDRRRNFLVYGLLLAVWVLVVAWQAQEHIRFKQDAKTSLLNRSKAIANTIGAAVRGMQFRGQVFQWRLQPILNELVMGQTNELFKSGEVISVALYNAKGETVAFAGPSIDPDNKGIFQQGGRWGAKAMTVVYPIEGVPIPEGDRTNKATLFVTPAFTNSMRERRRFHPPPRRHDPAPSDRSEPPPKFPPPPGQHRGRAGERMHWPPRRPPWAWGLSDKEYRNIVRKRELHGLALAMSIDTFHAACRQDLWMRFVVAFFAGVAALGSGLAWRSLAKNSELQIRLVRASELNTYLKEMNLTAAGLAHETRNPLNIIRGLAQMISKRADAPPEVQTKSRDIINEADKVASQLNEFINYSRPREVHRAVLSLGATVNEVVRTLNHDLDEKQIALHVKDAHLRIEADEQLLRQALFNLLLNAIQAANRGGEIQVIAEKRSATEACLDIRDTGPGVPPDKRTEIFKPYFTTQPTGTGLGLAVVQQIVLAHGWEIQCLPNEPTGAIFRITHLKLCS